MNKLGADCNQERLIQFGPEYFVFQFAIHKIWRLKCTGLQFCFLFYVGVKP